LGLRAVHGFPHVLPTMALVSQTVIPILNGRTERLRNLLKVTQLVSVKVNKILPQNYLKRCGEILYFGKHLPGS
jgi:hypothetical protein